MCYSEHDNRGLVEMTKTNNSISTTIRVPLEEKCVELRKLLRVTFNNVDSYPILNDKTNYVSFGDILSVWSDICIRALELRMDSCTSMLFRNYDNIVVTNENQIIFKKPNGQLHIFNIDAYKAMEAMKLYLEKNHWNVCTPDLLGTKQLLKALYLVPDADKHEREGYDFDKLISVLEETTIYTI